MIARSISFRKRIRKGLFSWSTVQILNQSASMAVVDILDKKQIIKSLPLFQSLNETKLETLSQATHEKVLPANTTFIEQEDEPISTYIIISGSVRVYRISPDGEEINLAILGPGEVVGEMSLLDDEPRSASVETIQETKTLVLDRKDFLQIIHQYPDMAINLLSVLSKRIRLINEHLEDTFSKTLPERTWKILQALQKYFPEGVINLSHEELSSIVGASRARITEVLDEFAQQGKIILSHRKIHLR